MRLLFFIFIFTLCSCSTDTVKQMTYETVQNLHQQECQKNRSLTDCDTRQNYDNYQQSLKEIK